MGRNKHSIAKEIQKADPTELKLQKAKLGKLHHMSEEAEAIRIFRDEYQTRAFRRGACSPDEEESGDFLIDRLIKSVLKGDSHFLHEFAEVLEICVNGRDVSPIESFLALLKANYERDTIENPKAEWLQKWPFTVSELRRRCLQYTKVPYSTKAVREAANLIGLEFKDLRGRPKNR